MPRTTLLATTAVACLVLALGCGRRTKAADPPPNTISVQRVSDSEPISAPRPARPEPAMSTPPTNEALDAPAPSSEPEPVAPRQSPSQYEDGCGRPLVT